MYLIASKSGILTGRRLASNLDLRFHTNPNSIDRHVDVLIRYGNAMTPNNIRMDTEVNSARSILIMSNKKGLYGVLKDQEILVPQYIPYRRGEVLPERIEFPVLARQNFHRGGLDITVCNRPQDIPWETEFLVPYYPTTREYRVHVLFGEVVKVMRKWAINEATANPYIRTSFFGWQYRLSSLDEVMYAESLVETAKKAAAKVGCAFCGVDVAWSKQLRRWIVWEMNSAPSLNESSLSIYESAIKSYFTKKFGSRHEIR